MSTPARRPVVRACSPRCCRRSWWKRTIGLAWVTVPPGALERHGVDPDDLDGVVEHARSVRGVRLALLFREMSGHRVKVSLRSVGDVNVAELARQFGGGGHAKAAGVAIHGTLAEVQGTVLKAAREYLFGERTRGLRLATILSPVFRRRHAIIFRMMETELDVLTRIERTIDELRPYIASHRGSVEVVDFDAADGRLLVRLGGTCVGCSASTVTLKQGLEQRLRHAVPEVLAVEAV